MKIKREKNVLNENDMARYVREAVSGYFVALDGEQPSCAVYDMVINCVEKPLLETVLHRLQGNQSHAARILGMTRGFLRNKIREHGIRITQAISVEGEEDESEAHLCVPET